MVKMIRFSNLKTEKRSCSHAQWWKSTRKKNHKAEISCLHQNAFSMWAKKSNDQSIYLVSQVYLWVWNPLSLWFMYKTITIIVMSLKIIVIKFYFMSSPPTVMSENYFTIPIITKTLTFSLFFVDFSLEHWKRFEYFCSSWKYPPALLHSWVRSW